MLQHRFAAVAASGLLLLAVTGLADDRMFPRGAALAQANAATCDANAPGCRTKPQRSFRVGDIAPPAQLHRISAPGVYGLSDPPNGHVYGVLDGELIRVEASSGKILSVLWRVDQIRD